jgi:hypothetical protein
MAELRLPFLLLDDGLLFVSSQTEHGDRLLSDCRRVQPTIVGGTTDPKTPEGL